MQYVEFEGEKYWEIGEEWGTWYKPDQIKLLPSDSCLRADINYLKEKDYENAQAAKEELEEIQRKDKAIREENRKK